MKHKKGIVKAEVFTVPFCINILHWFILPLKTKKEYYYGKTKI